MQHIPKNSPVEICPTLEVGEVGNFALLDFVMKFKKGKSEEIVAPLGCGMLYNHSSEPNVRWRCVPGVGGDVVVMTARRDLKEGEELFIDYGDRYWALERQDLETDGAPPGGLPSSPYYIAGTWDNFTPTPMQAFGDGLWRHSVTLGEGGEESFQILLRGDWRHALYPSVQDANPYVEHELLGPDDGGHGVNWTIGRDAREAGRPGVLFDIVLSVDARAVAADVSWHRCVDGVPGWWA